jgi:hypothetical protein
MIHRKRDSTNGAHLTTCEEWAQRIGNCLVVFSNSKEVSQKACTGEAPRAKARGIFGVRLPQQPTVEDAKPSGTAP